MCTIASNISLPHTFLKFFIQYFFPSNFSSIILAKLQKLIALTLTGTNAIVKINNKFTDKFDVQTGVKQGDPLSATLFSIAMDSILKKIELRGNISTRLKQ
jgi:hypothetical protein